MKCNLRTSLLLCLTGSRRVLQKVVFCDVDVLGGAEKKIDFDSNVGLVYRGCISLVLISDRRELTPFLLIL